ncbi:MAG: MBL fold metallo-hydrolase [Oscillospiraceae bacterium]|jgi:beta-lactamase superfamily II metal-dependent hydrolase|nr:MBL fold metallo-hydrolase [Oscillospiraceae bacterium]
MILKHRSFQSRLHGTSRRKRIILSVLLLGILAASAVPFSASSLWNHALTLFGLGDFSSCADSWPVSVHVLDVGKADSILVECEGHRMLVDGGTAGNGKIVVRYLERRGTTHLEYVVNTHPDEDHVGGLKYVIQRFPISHYLATEVSADLIPDTPAYHDTMKALQKKEISKEISRCGHQFSLGNLKVRVLGPVVPGNSANNCSLVLQLQYRGIRILLMGDAEKEEEQSLINTGTDLSADILKAGHHGSSTSTTAELLNAVRPDYAVISVGYDRNQLPKTDVLKRLYRAGIQTYRTDVSGTVLFLTDGKTISVKTEKQSNTMNH